MARSAKNKESQQEDVLAAQPKTNPIALTFIGLIYFVLTTAYNFIVPAGTTNQHNADENAHVLYVQTLVAGHLPVFVTGANAYENHQPPLYYVLCVPLYLIYKSMGPTVVIHALRFVSALFGTYLAYVAYKTSELMFPGKTVLNISVAAFIAFLPMNVNLNASVSNDSLTNLVLALGLWQGVKIVVQSKEKQSDKWIMTQALIFGLILGVGIWTKTSTLLLFPLALLIYVLAARRGLMDAKFAFRAAITTLFTGLVIGAPWFLRNQMLYGDPVAQHIFQNAFGNTAQADTLIRFIFQGDIGAYLAAVTKWTFASYWGVFDSMSLFWGQSPTANPPPLIAPLASIYYVILAVIGVSCVGLIRMMVKKPDYITPATGISLSAGITLVFLTAFVFLRFVLVFFQAQGRYIYPSLLPLTILFWLGLFVWTDKPLVQRIISSLLLLGLVALNVYTLYDQMLPRFAPAGLAQGIITL